MFNNNGITIFYDKYQNGALRIFSSDIWRYYTIICCFKRVLFISCKHYLVGDTQGALPGKTSAGGKDIILIALELTSDPVVLLMPLIDQVSDYNLHHGIQQSFDAKLDAALKSLNDLKQNNDTATKKALEAFINSVLAQRGKEISVADADMFIATAQEIIILLNGG
ncbi:hypothetical protein BMR04_08450 [Methylococcaceae bacterium HT3]|nr:hypothetical protein BMR04_08450 [Methylococcaceae bacterium HT3]TXL23668.1 hypothetical protein BMR03_01575 [Methylococcaceae bacterium HT2]